MKLNQDITYIVSGLERSGTSMLMQMLHARGLPIAYDDRMRPPDESNPRGYYELEGGKIINKLINGTLPLDEYKGRFIKITAYGLKYLPRGKYKIIFSERNIEEILDSMEKMAGVKDKSRDETRRSFVKLNTTIKKQIQDRDDIEVLFVNYNNILTSPKRNIEKIHDFLELSVIEVDKMIRVVDKKLYRQRRIKNEKS